MAKFLSDDQYAVRGRLMAIDNSEFIGPYFILRTPPNTFDMQRPGSYIDFRLLDTNRKTLQKRIHLDDELKILIHAATPSLDSGTQNEPTFAIAPRSRCQRISHCHRTFAGVSPINGQVVANDEHHMIVIDAGVPIVVSLLGHKPTQTKKIELESWATFWPTPPTHGIILGKI